MIPRNLDRLLLGQIDEEPVWELFHENSKLSRYSTSLSDKEVLDRMKELHESLPFVGYPIVDLPRGLPPLDLPLEKAIVSRISERDMTPATLDLTQVTALLHYSYGVTRAREHSQSVRPLRVVPSGGSLYPLEVYFHSAHVAGLPQGLYHYNPSENYLRYLRHHNETDRIAKGTPYPSLILSASLVIFITGVFERSTFKYGDRGYRFTLLEAGHVAQNINLVTQGLGLACVNIGGFFDRDMDAFLELDGLLHSTIYMVAIGKKTPTVTLFKNGNDGDPST